MSVFPSPVGNLPKACEDIGVKETRFLEDVATLKEWLQQQPHLPMVEIVFCADVLLVENMLLRCKGSVEVAKQALDMFFSVRTRFPDLFTGTDPCSEEMVLTRQTRKVFYLKNLTREGYRISMTSVPSTKYLDVFVIRDYFKDMLMTLDVLISDDISAGTIYIIDMSAVTLHHTAILLKNFDDFQKTMYCIFRAYRSRIKAVHLMYPPTAAQSMIKLLIRVSPKKLSERFYMHADLQSLHQHFDKDIFPKDYGGNQKSSIELSDDYNEEVKAYRQRFLDNEISWLTDETKRPLNCAYSNVDASFGMDGTFRKLEVD